LASTPVPRAALRDACVEHFRRVSAALLREDEHLWQDLELTMGQFKAMIALGLNGPLSVGGLGRTLDISEPSASLLCDQLERQGLVRREQDAADRRRVLVAPVAEGLERIDALRHGRRERAIEWLDQLADDDLEALSRGLGALAELAGHGPATKGSQR